MSDLTTNFKDLKDEIRVFRGELPNPITSLQSAYIKELFVEDRKITLLAQKTKGAQGMTWSVNVSQYHN